MTNFTDGIYSHAFCARVNDELGSGKTAIQMWMAIREHLFRLEGVEGLDTAPREFLLMIMDERGVRGFDRLAKRMGYVPIGKDVFEVVRKSWEDMWL